VETEKRAKNYHAKKNSRLASHNLQIHIASNSNPNSLYSVKPLVPGKSAECHFCVLKGDGNGNIFNISKASCLQMGPEVGCCFASLVRTTQLS
jgi:hypothetical protein